MTYSPSIPQANDLISVSQGQIQANFTALNTIFGINHVPFSGGTGTPGKHNFVSLPVQSVDPTTASQEMAIYTKAVATIPTLFVRQQSNGAVFPLQTGIAATQGSLTLGAVTMNWGTLTSSATSSGSAVVTFATAYSAAPYNYSASYGSATGGVASLTIAPTGTPFVSATVAWNTPGTSITKTIYWFAIGPT